MYDEDDDESEKVPCPSCGAEVYEEAERCPSCGEYIAHSTSPWGGKPWLWIVLGLMGIFSVVYSSMRWTL